MILVDTSVWITHLRVGNATLVEMLERGAVVGHPWVVGELALGHLRQRATILEHLRRLPQSVVATAEEVLAFVDRHALFGRGIGYVDAHLLAATQLTSGATLWTEDRRLAGAAGRLGIRFVAKEA